MSEQEPRFDLEGPDMSEIADPMPDHPLERLDLEAKMDVMEDRARKLREKATENVDQSPQQILDDFGGADQAERLIGSEAVKDLKELQEEEDMEKNLSEIEKGEN